MGRPRCPTCNTSRHTYEVEAFGYIASWRCGSCGWRAMVEIDDAEQDEDVEDE